MGSNTNKQLTIQAFRNPIQAFRNPIGNKIRNQIAQNEAHSCVAGFGLHHHNYGFSEASGDQRRFLGVAAKNGEKAKDARTLRMLRRIHYKLRADGEKGEKEKRNELIEENSQWTDPRTEQLTEDHEERFCDEPNWGSP